MSPLNAPVVVIEGTLSVHHGRRKGTNFILALYSSMTPFAAYVGLFFQTGLSLAGAGLPTWLNYTLDVRVWQTRKSKKAW